MRLLVNKVLIHYLGAHFQVFDVAWCHVHKDRRSLYNESEVNTHAISAKGLKLRWIHIKLVFKFVVQDSKFLSLLLRSLGTFVFFNLFK